MLSLHDAAKSDDIERVRFLLSSGASVNDDDDENETQIMITGNSSTDKRTPLHCVALRSKKNGLEIIRALVDSGADVNAKTFRNSTPLHFAAMSFRVETVRELIELGAEVNRLTTYGHTPLTIAAMQGLSEMVHVLVHLGDAQVNMSNEQQGTTALHHAARASHATETVKILLSVGADVNQRGRPEKKEEGEEEARDYTPLHFAAMSGCTSLAILLIEAGADVDALNGEGETPYRLAMRYEHTHTARALVEHGADTNVGGYECRRIQKPQSEQRASACPSSSSSSVGRTLFSRIRSAIGERVTAWAEEISEVIIFLKRDGGVLVLDR